MTVGELINTAGAFCELAERETGRDRGSLEKAAQYATIAHAHAATAQAIMMRDEIAYQHIDAERDELKALWK